jgi:hypothetical protein
MPFPGMLSRLAFYMNLRFGGTHCLHHQGDIQFLRSVRQSLVTANVFPSSPIFVTLMIEALRSSERSVLTRAIQRNIPEDGILLRTILKIWKWRTQTFRFNIRYQISLFNVYFFISY